MMFRVTDKSTGAVLAERASRTTTVLARMRGLLGRSHLSAGEGLHLAPCKAIHTLFMRFPIDVLFLSPDDSVVRALHWLPPWCVIRMHRGALSVLELPAGTLARTSTQAGHRIFFERLDSA
jgi:uncharacterized membrane protein (UPF0127 family)